MLTDDGLPGLEPRRRRPALGRGHERERGRAVDRLADDVGVAGMTGGLADEMHEHPPYRPRVEVVGVPRHALRHGHRLTEIVDGAHDRFGLRRHVVGEGEQVGERLVRAHGEALHVVVLPGPGPLPLHHQVDPPLLGARPRA